MTAALIALNYGSAVENQIPDTIRLKREELKKALGSIKQAGDWAAKLENAALVTEYTELAQQVELILVIGSENSSNSKRLAEVAQALGTKAYLIDDVTKIDPVWLEGIDKVGITAGASAPEHLVEEVVTFFRNRGTTAVQELTVIPEDVRFGLPSELKAEVAARIAS